MVEAPMLAVGLLMKLVAVLFVLVSIGLILVILIQKGKGGGLAAAFGGGMDKDVHQAVLDYGCKVTGCTIHFADETPDGGPVIAQQCVKIEENDTIETLKQKVQAAEMRQYVRAVDLYAKGKLKVEGRCVRIFD